MIGLVDLMESCSSIMDRKRRRLDPTQTKGATTDRKRTKVVCSKPPKWHTSLKQHMSNAVEEDCKPASLCDVTQLLVDSGYVNIVDIHHTSQTCSILHRLTNRQSVWKSFCEQEFPGGTKQIHQGIVKEKGYRWLYHQWKSTIQSVHRHQRVKTLMPLPPPRLSPDQMIFYIHINQDGHPLHRIPIFVTGNDLLPLLKHGTLTYRFPEPIVVTVPSCSRSTNDSTSYQPQQQRTGENIQVRMHLLSIPDATMCCVYNESMPLCNVSCSYHHNKNITKRPVSTTMTNVVRSTTETTVQSQNDESHNCFDFGPTDVTAYSNCELRLRHSTSTAAEINHRLLSNTMVFRVGLYCSSDVIVGPGKGNNSTDRTTVPNDVSITGIRIEVMKYDRTNNNSCHIFDSTMEIQHGTGSGVTLLHYLSDLQLLS